MSGKLIIKVYLNITLTFLMSNCCFELPWFYNIRRCHPKFQLIRQIWRFCENKLQTILKVFRQVANECVRQVGLIMLHCSQRSICIIIIVLTIIMDI